MTQHHVEAFVEPKSRRRCDIGPRHHPTSSSKKECWWCRAAAGTNACPCHSFSFASELVVFVVFSFAPLSSVFVRKLLLFYGLNHI